jgi:hypothetical protein
MSPKLHRPGTGRGSHGATIAEVAREVARELRHRGPVGLLIQGTGLSSAQQPIWGPWEDNRVCRAPALSIASRRDGITGSRPGLFPNEGGRSAGSTSERPLIFDQRNEAFELNRIVWSAGPSKAGETNVSSVRNCARHLTEAIGSHRPSPVGGCLRLIQLYKSGPLARTRPVTVRASQIASALWGTASALRACFKGQSSASTCWVNSTV